MAERIVFYDAECGLCEHSVKWLLDRDRLGRLYFAPLGGETAEGCLLDAQLPQDLDSLIYFESGAVYWHSDAPLMAVRHLPSRWSWLRHLRFFPKGFRDAVYRLVARNRIRVFGAATHCRLPTPEESRRLLP